MMYHLLPLRDNKRTHEDDSDKDKKGKKQKEEKNDKKNPKECKPGKVELRPNAKNDANQHICLAFNRIAQFVVQVSTWLHVWLEGWMLWATCVARLQCQQVTIRKLKFSGWTKLGRGTDIQRA